MSRVLIVTHPERPAAAKAAADLESSLAERAVEVQVVDDAAAPANPQADLVVAVGGDGTFLRAALAAWAAGSPVLGVKVGRLGFLTEVDPDLAATLARRVLEGTARIEERLALVAEPSERARFGPLWALNEITVEKQTRHRLVRLQVEVNGTYVTTFSADGVIVASPTGSTAYSFSARGPIVEPDLNCMVLTPIAAHMVFDRSFVLGPGRVVNLRVVGDEGALLAADGRESVELPVGASIKIHAADRSVRLVRRDDAPDFLSLVRGKFDLPGEPNNSG